MQRSPIPSPANLLHELPINAEQALFIEKTRAEIQDILEGKDSRILCIVGPCSIHDSEAAQEYASRLQRLANQLSDHMLIVMRTYFEKSRTSMGWKGMIHDPFLDESFDVGKGVEHARRFLLDLAEQKLPAATEFLDPLASHYVKDLISWGCIGARSTSSQIHRQLAAALPMPIGFKNNTDGNVQVAIDGIHTAAQAQSFLSIDDSGSIALSHTLGNPHGHLVVRGGKNGTNYEPTTLASSTDLLEKNGLAPALLVDCSHGNSQRSPEKQGPIFQEVLQQAAAGNFSIRGLLLESFLFEGRQPHPTTSSELQYGVSITDGCLSWNQTEKLLLWAHNLLKETSKRPLPEKEWVRCS